MVFDDSRTCTVEPVNANIPPGNFYLGGQVEFTHDNQGVHNQEMI